MSLITSFQPPFSLGCDIVFYFCGLVAMENDGVFLIDAANAFNRVNRAAVLWNVQFLCPPLKYILINTYRNPSRIFVCDNTGKCREFSSREGTTQGCPLAMAMYAVALIPLVRELKELATQVWYADDATGVDKLENLKAWFDKLLERGPLYGYFPQPKKCVLIVREEKLKLAKELFKSMGIEITTVGKRHLGAALGSETFKKEFIEEKVKEWISQVRVLAKFAASQPHAAFSAFTHCLQGRWTFISRTIPGAEAFLTELEKAIREEFIPAILKRPISENERELFSIPARFGGLGISNPCTAASMAFNFSCALSAPLVNLVLRQVNDFNPVELRSDQDLIKAEQDAARDFFWGKKIEALTNKFSHDTQKAIQQAKQKGASSWVTARPLHAHHTVLHKGDFRDALYIRYGWPAPFLPAHCACGAKFSLQHSLDCLRGGYRNLQHNEVRDVVAECLKPIMQESRLNLSSNLCQENHSN